MTNSSYKVRIWNLEPRKNVQGKVTSYRVRWEVDGNPFRESFKLRVQADSFRSDLLSAQRRGEGFDKTSGLPSSLTRADADMTWFDFTCKYVDMKWPDLAATARQTVAEALIRVALVFVPNSKSAPDEKLIRSVLRQWGYNSELRKNGAVPPDVRKVLDWCSRSTASVKTVPDPDVLRSLQRAVTKETSLNKLYMS